MSIREEIEPIEDYASLDMTLSEAGEKASLETVVAVVLRRAAQRGLEANFIYTCYNSGALIFSEKPMYLWRAMEHTTAVMLEPGRDDGYNGDIDEEEEYENDEKYAIYQFSYIKPDLPKLLWARNPSFLVKRDWWNHRSLHELTYKE